MANEREQLAEMLNQDNQPATGFFEAVKDAVQAIAPGLSLNKMLSDVGSELERLGVQGQMELASVLYNHSAFVPYGPGAYAPTPEQAPENGLAIEAMKQPEVEQGQGMEM